MTTTRSKGAVEDGELLFPHNANNTNHDAPKRPGLDRDADGARAAEDDVPA